MMCKKEKVVWSEEGEWMQRLPPSPAKQEMCSDDSRACHSNYEYIADS